MPFALLCATVGQGFVPPANAKHAAWQPTRSSPATCPLTQVVSSVGSLTYRGQRRTFATDGQPGKTTMEMYQVWNAPVVGCTGAGEGALATLSTCVKRILCPAMRCGCLLLGAHPVPCHSSWVLVVGCCPSIPGKPHQHHPCMQA